MKRILAALAAALSLAVSLETQAANPVPPLWRGGLPATDYGSCPAIAAAVIAQGAAQGWSFPYPGDPADPCAANAQSFYIRFDRPCPSGQCGIAQVFVFAFCPTGGFPNWVPGLGWDCGSPALPMTKNVGRCRECGQGNPIFPATGNKMQHDVDYVGAGPFPLRFERTYNSMRDKTSNAAALGTNWTHSYHRMLTMAGPNASTVSIVGVARPDGRTFGFMLSGGSYVGDPDVNERLEKVTGGWKLTNEDDEVELYDDLGTLASITNRAGLTQTLSHHSTGANAGRINTVTDPFGRTLTFQYNEGQISAIVTPDGTYGYGRSPGDARLTSVTYPDGRTRTYHYEFTVNVTQLLTGITDEKGVRFANFGYQIAFSVYSYANLSEHAGGAGRVTASYSLSGENINSSSVTAHVSSTSSATRSFSLANFQGVRRNTAITGPACPTCGPATTGFNTNGYVNSRQDWNGFRSSLAYDTARNLETLRAEGLSSAGADTPETVRIQHQWHPTFRLPTAMAEPLRITSYTHDAQGNVLTKSVQATTDANGSQGFSATPVGSPRVWTWTYNANGQVLTMDGPRTDVSDVTTYAYYANNDADINKRGNLASVTNAAGHVTQVTSYNAHGQPLTIVDPNGLTTTLAYDPRQRLTSRNVGGETTTYEYDSAGQLTKVTLPDSSFLSYTYDAAHRLTGIADNLGNRIAYTLDLAGNRTKEEVFDPANALVQTRSRVYSSINRLFQELGALGQTTEYGYDAQGNLTSVKDPLNKVTANQYDPLNRLKQVTDPASGVTLYGYNGLDALTQVTDPRALATAYTVNGLGDMTQQVSPDTGTTASTYDSGGNLATQTDAKGQLTTYAYDALNRVTLITFSDASKQAYGYDAGANGLGRLTSIAETNAANQQTSLIQYAYDPHGRVSSETRTVAGVAYVLAYQYDASGRLSGMTYPSGRTVSYSFDALGRVSQVNTTKDSQTQVVAQNVQYHPFGGAKSWTLGNGQLYSRTIDQDGRIAAYTLGGTANAIGFDAASRITGIGANSYGYDALDRLSSAVLPAANYAYSYDAVGNRLTKTTGANTDTYTYSATSNRIATVTPFGSPLRSFTFDANGSTTNDGVNTYAYDPRGRMVGSTNASSLATTYQVNALGQRIRKTNALDDRVFTYDTWGKLIAESDPGGTPKREYIYLGDIPVGVLQ